MGENEKGTGERSYRSVSPLRALRDEARGIGKADEKTVASRKSDLKTLQNLPSFKRFMVYLLRELKPLGAVYHPQSNIMNVNEGHRLAGVDLYHYLKEHDEKLAVELLAAAESSIPEHLIGVPKES